VLAALVTAGFGIISAALLILPNLVAQANAVPIVEFEPLDHVYNLTIGNQRYPIRYGFSEGNSAMVESMHANASLKSITVIINDNNSTTSGGNRSLVYFVIELPRNIINANTTEIAGGCSTSVGTETLWVLEHDIEYNIAVTRISEGNTAIYSGNQGELCSPDTRTLSIEYPTGSKSMIVIQGTIMIPEFSSSFVVPTIILLSMISGVLAAQRFWQLDAK
jgi:hypothetical protein